MARKGIAAVDPLAVDQRQGPAVGQSAERHVGIAVIAAGQVQPRHRAQNVTDIAGAAGLDLFLIDHGDRGGRILNRSCDRRGRGHQNLVQNDRFCIELCLGMGHYGGTEGGQRQQYGAQMAPLAGTGRKLGRHGKPLGEFEKAAWVDTDSPAPSWVIGWRLGLCNPFRKPFVIACHEI